MKLIFSDEAWDDYLYWQKQDRKIYRLLLQIHLLKLLKLRMFLRRQRQLLKLR